MIHDPHQETHAGGTERRMLESCTGCGASVVSDPVDGGLNCAQCGQWQALCAECMPPVSEHSRDAVWACPECRQ